MWSGLGQHPNMRLRPGAVVLDRYRITSTLGRGGMATTYLALDLLWNADVALKLLRAPSPDLLDALRFEFDVLRGLSLPFLTVVHDFAILAPLGNDDAEPLCFYTCDPIEGVTLEQAAAGADWAALQLALSDVLHALHRLHALGIRHGDVKPSNIIVRRDGHAVLIDLGCACPIAMGATQGISGTPDYLAPELLAGGRGDERADLFALGKVMERLRGGLREPLPAGIAPLMERLLRDAPEQRPSSAHEVLEALGCEPVAQVRMLGRSGVFVGRKGELQSVRKSIDALAEGHPASRVVWIRGDEGVGKSRFVRELKWIAQHRCRVVEVNPGAPRAVYDALARASRAPLSVHDLGALLRARERLAAGRASPTVLLLDDAHRLNEEQSQALVALLRGLDPELPLLLIASSPEPPPQGVDVEAIELTPLDLEALRSWVGEGLPLAAVRRLLRVSGGYPSSVRALLDQLERGALSDADLLDASVPLSHRRLEAAATLPSDTQRALGLIIVLGGTLAPPDLEAYAVEPSMLHALLAGGFVDRDGAGWRLVRSGEGPRLLEVVGEDAVRRLHLEVAESLREASATELDDRGTQSDRAARFVYHLAMARQVDRAVESLLAGEPLFELAPRTWRRAARAVAEVVDSVEVEVIVARLEQQAGAVQRAKERLDALLSRVEGRAQRALVRREIGACALTLGDVDGAILALEAAQQDASEGDERAVVSHQLARALTRKGAYREALKACEAALSDAGSVSLRVDLLETAAVACSFLGDSGAARQYFEQAAPLRELTDNPRRLVRSHGGRALVEYRAGNLEVAARGYQQALEAADKHGLSDQVATAALNLGTLCHQRGDWATAMTSYERGMRMAVALGQVGTETALRFNLAKLYADIGLFDRAWTAAERCMSVAQQAGQPVMAEAARTVLGEVSAARRDFRRAEAELAQAHEAFVERGRPRECAEISLQLAEIAFAQGDVDSASRLVEEAQQALRDIDARDVQLRVELGKARLGLAQGRPQDALPLAEAASRGAAEIGQRDMEAEAHLVLAALWETQGSALLARKHRDRAREVWEEAAARLPEAMRASFWKHPRRSALGRPAAEDNPERVSRREHKLELLIDINKRLNSSNDTQQVLTRAMDAAVELTGAERGFVLLARHPKGAKEKLHVAVARNLDREQVGRSHLKFSRAIAEQVVRDGQPVVTASARDDVRFRDQRSVHAMQLQSVVCVPVQSPTGILGALYLDNRFRQGSFGKEDVDVLLALADQVALALDNARLVDQLRERNAELERQSRRVEALAKGQAAEIDRLTEVVRSAQRNLERRYDYSNIIGASSAMQAVFDVLDRVIETSLPLLIQGDSGTGKELVAKAVHYQGPSRGGPLVSLNCGAVPEALIESELFGHVRGAFTGADRDRDGLVLKARGGTLFLDELGELPLTMQVKLLRVLQEREVRPVGAERSVPVDFRLVCATNRRLIDEVRKGTFREDLYYRVSVIELTLPSLRDRIDDIPELALHLLERASERTGRAAPSLTPPALRKLMGFHWPGNVRQLENVLLRASVLADSDRIRAEDIALPDPAAPSNALTRDEFEHREMQQIADTLAEHRWNVAHVARVLDIPRPTLYRKLKRYGLVRGKRR
jgi:transcriptional regulator with GAF, ATPase, and Fis domain